MKLVVGLLSVKEYLKELIPPIERMWRLPFITSESVGSGLDSKLYNKGGSIVNCSWLMGFRGPHGSGMRCINSGYY